MKLDKFLSSICCFLVGSVLYARICESLGEEMGIMCTSVKTRLLCEIELGKSIERAMMMCYVMWEI